MSAEEYRDKKAEEYALRTYDKFAGSFISQAFAEKSGDYKAGFDECRKYTLTQDEVIQSVVEALEMFRKRLGWDSIDGVPKPPSFNDCEKAMNSALAKFEELKKKVSE